MLSIRLESLVKHINYNDKIIDIGCDHALIDIYLVKNNIVKKIIVSDIHQNALDYGIKNIKEAHLDDKIEARLGDGLNVLSSKDNINTILISGMGTSTIKNILDHDYLKHIEKLIIQSNNDHYELRKYMVDKGYYIKSEDFLTDNNKHYINIVFLKGNKRYSKDELRYGPVLIHNKSYLNFELGNCQKIYNLVPKNKLSIRFSLKREVRKLQRLLK